MASMTSLNAWVSALSRLASSASVPTTSAVCRAQCSTGFLRKALKRDASANVQPAKSGSWSQKRTMLYETSRKQRRYFAGVYPSASPRARTHASMAGNSLTMPIFIAPCRFACHGGVQKNYPSRSRCENGKLLNRPACMLEAGTIPI
jgi:hypothetical protein